MDGLNEMMDFMDAFTLSSNAQEGQVVFRVEGAVGILKCQSH